MDPMLHRREIIRIITEAQCKFTVNFSGLHLLEIKKFNNHALLEFLAGVQNAERRNFE
jgi:hypothetical protein